MTDAKKEQLELATQLVHAGERRPTPAGKPTATPIYASATFSYDTMEETDQVFAGEKQGYISPRYANPTVPALEEAVKIFEAGTAACAYSTGMAALHAALFACELTPGASVLASQDIYGPTIDLLYNVFGSFDIKIATADFSDLNAVKEKALETRPRVMLAETISNPPLKVCDRKACADLPLEAGERLMIDNRLTSRCRC